MVDIEATGSDFNANAIVQIGAARFNDRFEVTDKFSVFLPVPCYRTWDTSTLEWWTNEVPDLYAKYCARDVDNFAHTVIEALSEFNKWLPHAPVMWAKPTHFDCAFLRSYAIYYSNKSLLNKLHPTRWMDAKSWIMGFSRKRQIRNIKKYLKDFPYEGFVHHDACDDAVRQVLELQNIIREIDPSLLEQ